MPMPLEIFLIVKIPTIVPVSDLRQGSARVLARGWQLEGKHPDCPS